MTDLEINTAIAKACVWEWKFFPEMGDGGSYGWVKGQMFPHNAQPPPFPNYASDLNAMHEAEKQFNPPHGDDWGTYLGLLDDITESRIHAPARKRAEAFLRTIGEWE